MARYLETAARYDQIPVELLALIPPEHHATALDKMARLVNAGVLCNPRPANGTVRLRAVEAVMKHVPVAVGLVERDVNPDDPTDTRTYKALTTRFTGETKAA